MQTRPPGSFTPPSEPRRLREVRDHVLRHPRGPRALEGDGEAVVPQALIEFCGLLGLTRPELVSKCLDRVRS